MQYVNQQTSKSKLFWILAVAIIILHLVGYSQKSNIPDIFVVQAGDIDQAVEFQSQREF